MTGLCRPTDALYVPLTSARWVSVECVMILHAGLTLRTGTDQTDSGVDRRGQTNNATCCSALHALQKRDCSASVTNGQYDVGWLLKEH